MHIPSHELHQEMLAVSQLIRFTYPFQSGERYPTLVIKAHSLMLKYIVQGVKLALYFFRLADGRLAYALYIEDDPRDGAFIWSVVAFQDEIEAIKALVSGHGCSVYLFNEACSNCAWAAARIFVDPRVQELIADSPVEDRDPNEYKAEVSKVLDRIRCGSREGLYDSNIDFEGGWNPLSSYFVLNGIRRTSLNLLFDNEGAYQEQLAHTLLGDLSPKGAYPNTQLHTADGRKREFMDLVLTHEFGTILLESKALSIFDQRVSLPDRAKLAKNVEKAAKKALRQLSGAAKKLRENVPVYDETGEEIQLEREQPIQAIILVPELDLLAANSREWFDEISAFFQATGGVLHILDTVELFRIMQAAGMIAKAYSRLTPVMAFDAYLLERLKVVSQARSINVDMLLRITPQTA